MQQTSVVPHLCRRDFDWVLLPHIDDVCTHRISPYFKYVKTRHLEGTGNTHVRPLCDDTYFRRASPISDNTSEGSGLRHSVSRS